MSRLQLRRAGFVVGAGFAGALGLSALEPARANGWAEHSGRPGYVVAESRWGNGTIAGAVRSGRHGWQVRMPRGTWIDCGRSCSETLRRETIDFWESSGPQAPGSGRGYLSWQFRY